MPTCLFPDFQSLISSTVSLYVYEMSSFPRMKNHTCKNKVAHLAYLCCQAQMAFENLSSSEQQQQQNILRVSHLTWNKNHVDVIGIQGSRFPPLFPHEPIYSSLNGFRD